MKVRELIEALRCEDPDAEVMLSYNYGDHWRTTVAEAVGRVEEMPVQYSDYHRMHRVVDDEDDHEAGDKTAVILSRR